MSQGERDIRETLSGFYQELHQRWKKAEELLLSYRVPAAVSVRIKTVQPAAEEKPFLSACHHDLGFVKHYGRWGICYGLSSDGTPGSLYWMSIQHCSAEQQVEAAACFPALLTAVTQAAQKYSQTVQEAMCFLQDALPGWPREEASQPTAAAQNAPVAGLPPVNEETAPQTVEETVAQTVEEISPQTVEEISPQTELTDGPVPELSAAPPAAEVPPAQEPEPVCDPAEQAERSAVPEHPEPVKGQPSAEATTEEAADWKEAA